MPIKVKFFASLAESVGRREAECAHESGMTVSSVWRELTDGEALPEVLFPPCMFHIKKGLEDGKKRALFVVVNFLRTVGWQAPQIEQYLLEWNKNNQKPLTETDIKRHVAYHTKKEKIL